MKKLLGLLLIATLSFTIGCNKDEQVIPDSKSTEGTPVLKAITGIPFVAGQTIPIGSVDITNDAANLYVTITLDGINYPDWVIYESHVYVGLDAPLKHSPGKFPYQHEEVNAVTDSYVIPIPADYVPGDPLYIAVHGEVVVWGVDPETGEEIIVDEETAWALPEGFIPFNQGWGGYFEYFVE